MGQENKAVVLGGRVPSCITKPRRCGWGGASSRHIYLVPTTHLSRFFLLIQSYMRGLISFEESVGSAYFGGYSFCGVERSRWRGVATLAPRSFCGVERFLRHWIILPGVAPTYNICLRLEIGGVVPRPTLARFRTSPQLTHALHPFHSTVFIPQHVPPVRPHQ